MDAVKRTANALPTTKGSAIQLNTIQNRGAKMVNVGSAGIVPKPVVIILNNTAGDEAKKYFIGTSAFLISKITGDLESPTSVSFNGTIDGLMDEIGSGTYFIGGITLRCDDPDQFAQAFEYVEGSNGRFYSEDLSTELLEANDGSNYNQNILPAVFKDGRVLALNKNSGLVVTVGANTSLSVTLIFKAVEDRVMGIYL